MRWSRAWYAGTTLSTLYLIRHGQASFGAEDYDVLSELGARQSRELGRHWAARTHELDAIYVGPRERQKDTAAHLLTSAREAGAAYPEPIELASFDEYPAIELLEHWMPILTESDPQMVELMKGPSGSGRFQRVFEYIIDKWAAGELDTGDLESFADFTTRVEAGLAQVMSEQGRGKRVAVVTSGGPISVAMRVTLGLADTTMLRVGSVVANSSISEFRYRNSNSLAHLAMVSFNNTPHICTKELLTYR